MPVQLGPNCLGVGGGLGPGPGGPCTLGVGSLYIRSKFNNYGHVGGGGLSLYDEVLGIMGNGNRQIGRHIRLKTYFLQPC